MGLLSRIGGQNLRRSSSTFIKASNIDISANSIPKVTGSGPFIDLPKFQPVGSSNAILNIQLPVSGLLNIRTTSIVALNGNVGDFETNIKYLCPGVWYQSVRLKSAASVLASGDCSHYLLLNVNPKENWFLKDVDNVFAWSGFDLCITPSMNEATNVVSLKCEGSGSLVVQSTQRIFEIQLEAGEKLLVNPNSLVCSSVPLSNLVSLSPTRISAFSNSFSFKGLNQVFGYIGKSVSRFYGTVLLSMNFPDPPKIQFLSHFPTLGAIVRSLKQSFQVYFMSGSPLCYAVEGPAKLVIADKCQVPERQLFTKTQILRRSVV